MRRALLLAATLIGIHRNAIVAVHSDPHRCLSLTADADSSMWLGVPFAAPPVGPLRWKAPQPPSYSIVRQASAFGFPCSQAGPFGISAWNTSEDCLYVSPLKDFLRIPFAYCYLGTLTSTRQRTRPRPRIFRLNSGFMEAVSAVARVCNSTALASPP